MTAQQMVRALVAAGYDARLRIRRNVPVEVGEDRVIPMCVITVYVNDRRVVSRIDEMELRRMWDGAHRRIAEMAAQAVRSTAESAGAVL